MTIKTFLYILYFLQKYGIPLIATARLQMNVVIDKNSGFGYFDKILKDKIVFPFLWIEDGVHQVNEVQIKPNTDFTLKTLLSIIH
jgi:hypothetical protein